MRLWLLSILFSQQLLAFLLGYWFKVSLYPIFSILGVPLTFLYYQSKHCFSYHSLTLFLSFSLFCLSPSNWCSYLCFRWNRRTHTETLKNKSFRPYFHYYSSNVNYCEDRFHIIRLYPRYLYVTSMYSQSSIVNVAPSVVVCL